MATQPMSCFTGQHPEEELADSWLILQSGWSSGQQTRLIAQMRRPLLDRRRTTGINLFSDTDQPATIINKSEVGFSMPEMAN